MTKISKVKMAGTEGTEEYVLLARTALGIVGVREFRPGQFRIRVEPTVEGAAKLATILTGAAGWKQPGHGQNRFSTTTVGDKSAGTRASVTKALYALISDGDAPETNYKAPSWQRAIVSRDRLERVLKTKKVRGANLAHRWHFANVCRKVASL